jgi:hypothetical protein
MEIIMILILVYQVTMPAVNNAKYTFGVVEDRIVRMNTQDGSFEECDKDYKCKPIIDN